MLSDTCVVYVKNYMHQLKSNVSNVIGWNVLLNLYSRSKKKPYSILKASPHK